MGLVFVGMGKLWGGMLAECFAKNLWWQYVFPLLEGGATSCSTNL